MSWMLLQQKQNDRVAFFDSDSEEKNKLGYKKFLDYVAKYPVDKKLDFIQELDKFSIIFLDLITGKWKIEANEYNTTNFTFDELCKANDVEVKDTRAEENKKLEKSKHEILVEKSKASIENMFVDKRKSFKKWGRS